MIKQNQAQSGKIRPNLRSIFCICGLLLSALLLSGCRPARAPGTPIAATLPAAPASTPIPEQPTTPVATSPATPDAVALTALLPTVTPTPPPPPITLPTLPDPWRPATTQQPAGRSAPTSSLSAETTLPSGQTAHVTLFALPATGLDLHAYLRGVADELAEQPAATLLAARLDDTLLPDQTPVARLDYTLTPPQGEPLAAIQTAHLDDDNFIVLTLSAPETARAELDAALRSLLVAIIP